MAKSKAMDLGPDEATVASWAAGLEEVIRRIGRHFARIDALNWAWAYLLGLMSDAERKNGWQLAEEAGNATPDGLQHLLRRAIWDHDGVRDELRGYVVEHLAAPWSVGVFDETGFLKKGAHSVGVQRQYYGLTGQVENCQVAVFLGYATAKGHALLDRALYLPESWTADRARCRQAGVPDEVGFATKPELATQMWQAARQAGVRFTWMAGDEVYGRDPALRGLLERHRQPYVLVIPANFPLKRHGLEPFPVEAAALVAAWAPTRWRRLSAGDGSKGPRLYDWAWLPVGSGQKWPRWLLARRSLTDPTDIAYYLVFGPAHSTLEEVVRVVGARWTIEESFERAKSDVGLDHYEVRTWKSWHRHITLAMWALAFLTVTCLRTEAGPDQRAADLAALKADLMPPPPTTEEPNPPELDAAAGTKKKSKPRAMSRFLQRRGLSFG